MNKFLVSRENEKSLFMLLKPPSTNHYYNHFHKRTVLSKEGRAFKEAVAEVIKDEKPVIGNVEVDITITVNDHRKHDVDNFLKSLLDSVKGYLFEDDNNITKLTISKVYGPENNFYINVKKELNN